MPRPWRGWSNAPRVVDRAERDARVFETHQVLAEGSEVPDVKTDIPLLR